MPKSLTRKSRKVKKSRDKNKNIWKVNGLEISKFCHESYPCKHSVKGLGMIDGKTIKKMVGSKISHFNIY